MEAVREMDAATTEEREKATATAGTEATSENWNPDNANNNSGG